MSEDEAAFIRAICLNPEDDAPRLIFADWLDENAGTVTCPKCEGHWSNISMAKSGCAICKGKGFISDFRAERAQFIRMQIKHPNGSEPHVVERRGRILRLCERPVWADLYNRVSYPTVLRIANTGQSWCEFRRGFPHAIRCPFSQLLPAHVRLFENFPIQRVELPSRLEPTAIRWLNQFGNSQNESIKMGVSSDDLSAALVMRFRMVLDA